MGLLGEIEAKIRGSVGGRLPRRLRDNYLAKLSVGFVIIVLLVSGIGGYTYYAVSNELTESVENELETEATVQSNELSQWLGERSRSVRMLSKYRVFRESYPGAISLFLVGETGQLPDDYVDIHYVDVKSKEVLASSSDGTEGRTILDGVSFLSRSWEMASSDYVAITDVYELEGQRVISFVSQVPGDRGRAVVMTASTDRFDSLFGASDDGSFTQVVDANGVVQFDGQGSTLERTYGASNSAALATARDGESGVTRADGNEVLDQRHLIGYAPVGDTGMVMLIHEPTRSAFALRDEVGRDVAALVLFVLLGLCGLGLFLRRTSVRPLRTLADDLGRIRDGDLDVDLATGRRDEFGTVVEGVERLRDDLRDQRADAEAFGATMQRGAEGDLTVRLAAESGSRDMVTVAAAFNEMMDDIEDTVATVSSFGENVEALSAEVADSAVEVNRASDEVARSVEQIAEGAQNQADSLTSVTAEMDSVSASVQQVAAAAEELSARTESAAARGAEGRESAGDARSGMDDIRAETERTVEEIQSFDDRIGEIGEIVEVITGIAEQTNILALNANIEAARAGEVGKGFAVVANEVKSLAEETQESAEEIRTLIEDVQEQRERVAERMDRMRDRVEGGATDVDEAVESLDELVEAVERTDESVSEITDATAAQADSTQEVLTMTEEVAGIGEETTAETQTVSAAAEEQTAALDEVTDNAESLADRSSRLQRLLARFNVGTVADEERASGFEFESPVSSAEGRDTAGAVTDGGRSED